MKKLLLLSMILCINSSLHCQKVSFVVKAGPAINTAPFLPRNKLSNATGKNTFLPGIKLMVSVRRLQFGIGIDYGNYKYQYTTKSGIQQDNVTMVASIPVACPYLFLNHKIKILKSYFFYGIDVGYTIPGNKLNQVSSGPSDRNSWKVSTGAHGISAGIHAGYNQHLVKKWSLQIEAGLRYLLLKSSYTAFDAAGKDYETPQKSSAFVFPVTLGVNYTF